MTLQALIATYQATKHAEDKLRDERRELGRQIADAIEHPDEGSKTEEIGPYRVTVTGSINRKVDWDLFDDITADTGAHAPYTVKRALDIKGIKWLQKNDPDTWEMYARAITSKPGSPNIKIKEVDGDGI